MIPACPTAIDPERTPIHLKFGTFATIISFLFIGALSVAGTYFMIINTEERVGKIEPVIAEIPVLKEKIATLDKNVQLLVDTLIYKKK